MLFCAALLFVLDGFAELCLAEADLAAVPA
jgi:hypothetical protein